MSNKEVAKSIIDKIPDYKIPYIVSFLKGFQLDDEIEDDLFCMRMANDYLNDDDPEKHESISFEDLVKELGLEDEVYN
ncbi:hypothetical protein [Anaerosporobacter sp.]|uniref:hypothetical protein n=1 Tax=Anaerosporobacter sp. TaxID=1872529 RepID=UPI00286EE173|nr:hypothetical protein [Anaerosporobacter sp.]